MRHLKSKKIWSQGTFIKFLEPPFPKETCQDLPFEFSWVHSIHKRSQCLKILMPIKTKINFFAPGVILMSIFQLLQVHIIPREIVGVAMGYSNDNLAKSFVHTLPHLAILKHNFQSVHGSKVFVCLNFLQKYKQLSL